MSSIFKSYVSIILIIVAVLVFVGIITVTLDVQKARDFHGAVVNEIENSNHSSSVIEACKETAEKNGYELVVSSYVNNSDGLQYSKITKVVLKYSYSISILDINSEKEIIGYAR